MRRPLRTYASRRHGRGLTKLNTRSFMDNRTSYFLQNITRNYSIEFDIHKTQIFTFYHIPVSKGFFTVYHKSYGMRRLEKSVTESIVSVCSMNVIYFVHIRNSFTLRLEYKKINHQS